MPKCVFVFGPEASGTRLMTRLLVHAGCVGDGTHYQPFDKTGLPPAAIGRDVVWRRSLPHGGGWPDVGSMIAQARLAGYEPRVVGMARNVDLLVMSQIAAGHARDREMALEHINRAHSILAGLEAVPARAVQYEALIADGWGVMLPLLGWLKLNAVLGEILYDGNEKHRKEGALNG